MGSSHRVGIVRHVPAPEALARLHRPQGPPRSGNSRVPAASGSHISQGCIDVVVGVPVTGDEEGQTAVWRQHVHATVLVSIAGQQGDAALLHVQRRRD